LIKHLHKVHRRNRSRQSEEECLHSTPTTTIQQTQQQPLLDKVSITTNTQHSNYPCTPKILFALNQGLLHQYQQPHSNNHTKMTASTPFNYWANNIFPGFRSFISSLHIMSHFIFTLYSHTPLPPPPYHPSPPQPTISTITATPLVAVLTLSSIFASAPCSRRQLIPLRCLYAQAT
jgi:hypothetical protein